MSTITKSQRGFLYWILLSDFLDADTKLGIRDILCSQTNEYVNRKQLNFLREKFIDGYIKLSYNDKKFLEEYCGKSFHIKKGSHNKYWFSWKNQPYVSWWNELNSPRLDGTSYQYHTIDRLIKNGSWVLEDKIVIQI